MKKNVVKKQVLNAISIGLAAVMMTTPITAFAAEGDPVEPVTPDPEPASETTAQENSAFTAVKEAEQKAETAVQTADTSETAVKNEVLNGNAEKQIEAVTAGEAGEDAQGNDLAQKVIDAANAVENPTAQPDTTLADPTQTTVTPQAGASLDNAQTALDTVEAQLGGAATNDTLADAAMEKATTEIASVEEAAKQANDIVDAANKVADEKLDTIKSTGSMAEANTAYSELEEAVLQAREDYNEKLTAYNTAKTNYETAVANVETYQKQYETALSTANANVDQAAADLAEAKKKADALKSAVDTAKEAVGKSAAGVLAAADKTAAADNSWANEDALFIATMENYYLPSQGISNATVKRVQGADNDSMNYFAVTYTDENGEVQQKYYNYKRNGQSKGDLYIFEKRVEEVNYVTASKENPDQYIVEGSQQVIKKDAFEAGKADGRIVGVLTDNNETVYLLKNEATASETKVENRDSGEITVFNGSQTQTVVTVDDASKKETYKKDENGNLVKEVTADVTTTTYTGYSLSSGNQYAEATKRDEAAAEAKAGLLQNANVVADSIVVTETSNTTRTYTATATFIPVFSKHVDVNTNVTVLQSKNGDDAKKSVFEDEKEKVSDKGNKVINASNSLSARDIEKRFHGVELNFVTNEFNVTGTVDINYEKITTETWGLTTWESLLSKLGFTSDRQSIEKAVKEKIEGDGGHFEDLTTWNWDWNTVKVTYIKGYTITAKGATEAEVKAALEKSLAAKLKELGAQSSAEYTVKSTKYTDTTTFGYAITYKQQTATNIDHDVLVATETYGNAKELTGNIVQNLNYENGVYWNTQTEEKYQEMVSEGNALLAKYEQLQKDATEAASDVEAAQQKVTDLKNEIEKLQKQDHANRNAAALKALEDRLGVAEGEKQKAEDKLSDLNKKLVDAGEALENTRIRLTPTPAPVAPVVTPEEVTPAGGIGGDEVVAAAADAGAVTDDTITIADVPVALAAVAATTTDAALADQAVLGARRIADATADQAVLGARRGADQAVLGKRRSPSTGDSAAMMVWLMSLGLSSTLAAAALKQIQKGKKED